MYLKNVIVGGNPAKVIKELDPDEEAFTRTDLFKDPQALEDLYNHLDRIDLANNSTFGWLRSILLPTKMQ